MNDENKIIIECLNTFGRVPEQWELLKMIKQLQSNWNSLREWLKEERDYYFENYYYSDFNAYGSKLDDVLDKMNELEGGDNDKNIK